MGTHQKKKKKRASVRAKAPATREGFAVSEHCGYLSTASRRRSPFRVWSPRVSHPSHRPAVIKLPHSHHPSPARPLDLVVVVGVGGGVSSRLFSCREMVTAAGMRGGVSPRHRLPYPVRGRRAMLASLCVSSLLLLLSAGNTGERCLFFFSPGCGPWGGSRSSYVAPKHYKTHLQNARRVVSRSFRPRQAFRFNSRANLARSTACAGRACLCAAAR